MAISTRLIGRLGGWRQVKSETDFNIGDVYAQRSTSSDAWVVSVTTQNTRLDMARDPHVIDTPY